MSETVVIHHPGTPTLGELGEDIPGAPTDETVPGCAFEPGATSENLNRQDVGTVEATLYCPPGTLIERDAQITVRGVTYEVDGDPQDWRSFYTDWRPGLVVALTSSTPAEVDS